MFEAAQSLGHAGVSICLAQDSPGFGRKAGSPRQIYLLKAPCNIPHFLQNAAVAALWRPTPRVLRGKRLRGTGRGRKSR